MPQVTTTSKQWLLDGRDLLKGAEFAAIGAVLGLVKTSVDAGSLDFNWQQIGKFALLAAISSIIKSWYSAQQTIIQNPK